MDPRKLLEVPALYSLFRRLIGGDSVRRHYAATYIRANSGMRVLDIGCGPGDILDFLPDVDYVGFDINPAYIERARRRFGGRARFLCEAVGETMHTPCDCDIAIAHGVVHHLDDSEATSLFRVARRALKPGGRLVTLDGCFTKDQSSAARFFVSRDRGRYVRSQEAYEALARAVFGDRVEVAVRHGLIRIPYTHIIMECTV